MNVTSDYELAELALKLCDEIGNKTNNIQEKLTVVSKMHNYVTIEMVKLTLCPGHVEVKP